MDYGALQQHDREEPLEDPPSTASSPAPRSYLASPTFAPLSLFPDHDPNTRRRQQQSQHEKTSSIGGLSGIFDSLSLSARSKRSSYEVVEDDDYDASSNIAVPRPTRPRQTQATTVAVGRDTDSPSARAPPAAASASASVRTASGRHVALRHPTPDLQTLQGAYTGNIEQLERTAERLSMTSSIDDAIRQLHTEQKMNDSRRSSLLSLEMPVSRQVSNAGSIVETNNLARSGGFSPGGFMMSPKGSFTTGGRGRPASRSSKAGSRPEPEMEGRPLESFANSPMSQSASMAHPTESADTLTRPTTDAIYNQEKEDQTTGQQKTEELPTPSSIKTAEQADRLWADFDGVHDSPQRAPVELDLELVNPAQEDRRISYADNLSTADSEPVTQRRLSSLASNNRLAMARVKSYADPSTGQQMVYYPAPVPMMLNLPKRLSKLPSSMARNQRRSQVLSTLPPGASKSAIWLPDVLEIEDEPDLDEDDGAQQMEYVAQHQRATMGGRRLTQDIQHLPPQLRASAFFDMPAAEQVVELKEQSAVATLDSILDASAHAPVSAFTDHVFAGQLGSEVYGKPALRNSRSSTYLSADPKLKKRASTFTLLGRRRASSSDLLDTEEERQRNTIADIRDGKIIREDGEDSEVLSPLPRSDGGEVIEEDEEEEEYHGAPTTLLAELQLRKQQQKHRTRHANGLHSTLLELDSVAQLEQQSRKQKRVNLAWEDHAEESSSDDEDVPLAVLYAQKSRVQEPDRPLGLMERRDLEDNEPLSRRRDRLQGRPPMPLHTTVRTVPASTPDEEQASPLPAARPVSGDFASEMMSQLGGPSPAADMTPISPPPEEEETLGQRRKRLQAEKEAREKEVGTLSRKRSMADILQAHPSAGAARIVQDNRVKPGGLLGLHDQVRSSSMLNLKAPSLAQSGGFKRGMYNDGQGGIVPPPKPQQSAYNMYNNNNNGAYQQFPQPSLGYGYGAYGNQAMMNPQMMFAANPNPYAAQMNMGGGLGMPMNGYAMPGLPMGMGMGMGMGMNGMDVQPLNQQQVDMVERWRQSVMH